MPFPSFPTKTFVLAVLLSSLFSQSSLNAAVTDDEFAGPFPSWTNVKTAYSAKGDGITDDTRALQQALDDLGAAGHGSNLYLPAGTYLTTGLTLRAKLGVGLIGADPSTTKLKYTGPATGTLLTVDGVAYSHIDRLTFDGSGTADATIDQSWNCSTGNFDTGNQYADTVFQGALYGIVGGNNGCGFAETTVLRSKFIGLTLGIILTNFNALDLWVWYSTFDRCGTGISNYPGAGNFNVYNSVFRSSTVADMRILNTGAFNIHNNFSSNSKAFWLSGSHYRYPAEVTLQGNSILNPGSPAIDIGNQGPALLLDNQIQTSTPGPVVSALNSDTADLITIGNIFPAAGAVSVAADTRWTTQDDSVATRTLVEPALPQTPPNLNRTIIEVPAGSNAIAIQAAINSAATLSRAVVHLPEGDYSIDRTLTIPANSDLQLIGDGYLVTRLTWTGTGTGPVIHLIGPNRATLREFIVRGAGNRAEGILIDGVDQRGSRIYLQQPQLTNASVSNLFVDGLDTALVDIRNIGHSGSATGGSVKVAGGPHAAALSRLTGRVNLFSGASSNSALSYDVSNGGVLLVRDMWYETSLAYPAFAKLSGSGRFTLQGSQVALPTSPAIPAIDFSHWQGNAALFTSSLNGPTIISGDGLVGSVRALGLVAGVANTTPFTNRSAPAAQSALLNSRLVVANSHSQQLADQGAADMAALRESLIQTRAEQPETIADTPSGTSDIRLHRVWVADASVGVHILNANAAACAITLPPTGPRIASASGMGTAAISAASGCPWSATSDVSWITITSGSSGTRDGSVYFTALANPSSLSRTGTLTIAGQKLTITQDGVACSFSLSPASAVIFAAAATGTIGVSYTPSDCAWTATSNSSWLTITSTTANTITYSAAANTTTTARTGIITVGNQNFTLSQPGQTPPITLTTTADTSSFNTYSAFTVPANSMTPQVRILTLSSSPIPASYTSSITGMPVFLTQSSSSPVTPATITLSANPGGLAPGTYTNTVTYTAPTGLPITYTISLTIQPIGSNSTGTLWPSKAGVFRTSAGLFLLDRNGDGVCCTGDLIASLGQPGDIALSGDWSGDGAKKIAIYRPSTGLFLLDLNNSGSFDAGDKALTLAPQSGDIPVIGDWTGTGVDRIGIFRNGTWYLDTNGDGSFTGRAFLGQSGDIPLVGNWNGAGTKSKAGIYRPNSAGGQPGNFFLFDSNGDGQYTGGVDQPLFFLGQQGDIPILGDWNGDGRTKVGIYRPVGAIGLNPGLFILDQNGNNAWDGPAVDKVLFFAPYLSGVNFSTNAQAGDIPITGNWVPSYTPAAAGITIAQGRTRTGLYRPGTGTFFLDATGDGTYQGRAFLGQSGDVPVGVPAIGNGAIHAVNLLGNW